MDLSDDVHIFRLSGGASRQKTGSPRGCFQLHTDYNKPFFCCDVDDHVAFYAYAARPSPQPSSSNHALPLFPHIKSLFHWNIKIFCVEIVAPFF